MKYTVELPKSKPQTPIIPEIGQPFRFKKEKYVYIRCFDHQGKLATGSQINVALYCMSLQDGQIYSVTRAMTENIVLLNDSQVVFTDLDPE